MLNKRLGFLLILSLTALTPACSSCGEDDDDPSEDMDIAPGDDMKIDKDGGSIDGDMDVLPDGGMIDPDMGDSGMVVPDMDPTDMDDMNPPAGEVVTCEGAIPAPTAGSLCNVSPGTGANVVVRGTILAEGTIYENGAVIYEGGKTNGKILFAGCDYAAEATAQDATLVECANGVVSPGMLNAHDHLTFNANGEPKGHGDERFDHRHDWRKGLRGHMSVTSNGSNSKGEAVQYAELRHLMAGTTSIAGSGGASGFLRNVDQTSNNGGLDGLTVEYQTFPLGDSDGDLIDSGCNYPRVDSENVLNNTIYLPHIAEGIDTEANNEFKCLNGGSGQDLIAANTSIIHGVGLTAADIADLSASGSKLVWSPRTNIDLYGQTADIPTFKRLGVTVGLGTDWIISGSMNMQREMACVSFLNSNYYNNTLTQRELFELGTLNSAIALGIDDRLGSIAAGKIADLVIYDGSEAGLNYRAMIDSSTKDVKLVMRGGEALYGSADLIDALVPAADVSKCETVDVCGNMQKVCAELDTGSTVSTLQSEANNPPYPLFFCDTPTNEPSCMPFRPDEYDGTPSGTDKDGDGIEDTEDICADIFNPKRPLSAGAQPNFDGDDDGDSCDVCPVSGAGDMCAMFDPDDRDSDGIANADDNCPALPNVDQIDTDADGQGDLCDSCPMDANPNGGACPASIYAINDGSVSVGSLILVQDAVVSGAGTDGFFIQVPEEAASYNGPDFSGLFVFARDLMPVPQRGDRVTVQGTVAEFRGGTQLTDPTLTVVSMGDDPAPIDVTEADLLRTGAKGEAYEGVLVRVDNVEVSDVSSFDQFMELLFTGGLYMDDTLFSFPKPEVGDVYTSVVGNVIYRDFSASNGNRISPRDANDLLTGPASLANFQDALVYLEANQSMAQTSPGLTVELSGLALADLNVDMTYTGEVSGPAQITVPQGQKSAPVALTSSAIAGTGTVTASYMGAMFTVDVITFDAATGRSPITLTPSGITLQPGGVQQVTVGFDVPGLQDGSSTATVVTDGDISAPATISIPAGSLTATFDVTADANAVSANSVTVSTPQGMVSTTVTVSALPSECLIISEVVEGASFNKAVEIYNCGSSDFDMTGTTLCQVNGANTNCSSTLDLAGTLVAGEVYVICNSQLSDKSACDIDSGVTSFNGDDRLILFTELGGVSGEYDTGTDTLRDAFGEFATQPGSSIWSNDTFDRCNFTPYDGVSAFDVDDYFTKEGQDTFSGLGVAPTSGCP